jgi:hypothetical protein
MAVVRFLVTVLVILVVLALVGVLVLRRVVRRVRRGVSDLRPRLLPPGPRRDAATLRRTLQAEMRATRDMLAHAPDGYVFRADATALLQELADNAATVDAELAAIERFIDAAQQRRALGALAPQAQRLIDATYSARHTILRTAAEDRARRLAALEATVAAQAAALDAYRRSDRQLRL